MSAECRNDCTGPLLFPRLIQNRPNLTRIGYRIGDYTDFRRTLIRALNQDPNLAGWTHREADDPGIALLEGASILSDILTFYQECYANEAYLRTAQWRESVADLVRLLGYRLSPGVGGRAAVAFEVKGDKPVTVPKGFPMQASLQDQEKPVQFETTEEVIASPCLSRFHLYRPRTPSAIKAGLSQLEVDSVVLKNMDGEEVERSDAAAITSLNLKPGDRLILIPDTSMFDEDKPFEFQLPAEILLVTKVEQILDRTIIEFAGSLTVDRDQTVKAYRIGRSFRHFGHNSPVLITKISNADPPVMTQDETNFFRNIYQRHSPTESDMKYYSLLDSNEMPLSSEIMDLAIGNAYICQGITGGFVPFTVVRNILSLRADALKWGHLSGPSTLVGLDNRLIANNLMNYSDIFNTCDIRQLQFHEVKSPKITLRAPTQWASETISNTTTFNYWGSGLDVLQLKGRRLILQKEDGSSREVTVSSIQDEELANLTADELNFSRIWPVTLAPAEGSLSDVFTLEDFGEDNPAITVYGNLVEANQGKTEKEAVLGSGNSREIFQTFKLPKSLLTYFRTEEETVTEAPELEVYVNNRCWMRVASFYGHGPKEEIYIVREDADGVSWVQFGDGKTGNRLPSGRQNVTARYRTGVGAFGPLREGAAVQAGARLPGLHKIHLPGISTGGDEAETAGNARHAAPGKVQSLGRLVSLKDFEVETLGIAGVRKTAARWALYNGVPAVVVTVLMKCGRQRELDEVWTILNQADRDRGAGRFPVIVLPGIRQYVTLDMIVGYNPAFRESLLRVSIDAALGISGAGESDESEGLFSADCRQFGQAEYATRIEARVQNLDGIVWARVKSLATLTGESENPAVLAAPADPARNECVLCSPERAEHAGQILLGLHSAHFHLTLLKLDASEVKSDG